MGVERTRTLSRTTLRWTWIPTVLFAFLFVLPYGGAVGAPALAKHVAPFHGTLHVGSTVTNNGCGGSATLLVSPTFNFSTGVGRASGKSAATGCGPTGFADYGSTYATTGLDSAAFLMTAPAAHNFSFSSRVNATWNLSATPASPAGGPFAWASAGLILKGYLWDLTNATLRAGFFFIDTILTTNGTTTGNASGTIAGPFTFKAFSAGNMTVVGHHYMFVFFVEIFEWAYAPSGTATHASARINMGSAGHSMKLVSWSTS